MTSSPYLRQTEFGHQRDSRWDLHDRRQNAAGSSDTFPARNNRLIVVDPNSTADSDGDGYPDIVEAEFGSDPFDPASTPDLYSKGEADSLIFSILNKVNRSNLSHHRRGRQQA
jgi:Bacterial TSP3 repeat